MNTLKVILGILLGPLLLIGPFFGLLYIDRRKRRQRKERPPQRTKLLRPAGHSLLCRLQELEEKLTAALMLGMVGAAFFGIALVALFPLATSLALRELALADAMKSRLVFTWMSGLGLLLAGLAFAVAQLIRVNRQLGDIRNTRFGLRGEQAVAEALASTAVGASGYVAFHDIPGDGPWNIDHVVVGPGGVFVMETKARARRKAIRDQKEHVVIYHGKSLIFPWCEDREAVPQAKRNADWVRKFIGDFAPQDILVQPVVVLPGWFVETRGDFPVKVMNAEYLARTYLPSAKRTWLPDQLRSILRRLEDRCRDVEF